VLLVEPVLDFDDLGLHVLEFRLQPTILIRELIGLLVELEDLLVGRIIVLELHDLRL
jgi:hypothetical protein